MTTVHPLGYCRQMDTTSKNKFAEYLDARNNWGRSHFYHRADISSNYFSKLRQGLKRPGPDTIVRLALATEGECQPSDVFMYFEAIAREQDKVRLLEILREEWIDALALARREKWYDLDDRVSELYEDGHAIAMRMVDGRREYHINE